MKLAQVELGASPFGAERVRLSGELAYATPGRPVEQIWFDVEERFASGLSTTGNPWITALLPVAVTLGESLEISLPVDAKLREGVEALMGVWSGWFPGKYRPIRITCDVTPSSRPDQAARTATLFSAGVDSFYTLLRHEPGGSAHDKLVIDDLLTVWGFDIPLSNGDAFEALHRNIVTVAEAAHKTPVTIATNLRESGWSVANWGRIAQGPALAAVGLALERRYRRVLIPSSVGFHSRSPWGTHPLTDPLLSTSRTEIRDDGALARRVGKVEALLTSDLALQNLHVCWMGQSASNCGQCEKCLRTLTALELLRARDRATTFPQDTWSPKALATLRLRNPLDREAMQRTAELATQYGRGDVARAAAHAIRRYDLRSAAGRLARAIGLR